MSNLNGSLLYFGRRLKGKKGSWSYIFQHLNRFSLLLLALAAGMRACLFLSTGKSIKSRVKPLAFSPIPVALDPSRDDFHAIQSSFITILSGHGGALDEHPRGAPLPLCHAAAVTHRQLAGPSRRFLEILWIPKQVWPCPSEFLVPMFPHPTLQFLSCIVVELESNLVDRKLCGGNHELIHSFLTLSACQELR